jgi:hypothetical protein
MTLHDGDGSSSSCVTSAKRAMLRLGVALAIGTSVGLSGCLAHGSAYVEADAPADIEVYPSTYYEGHTVYLVGDRWYVRDHDRWAYYSQEPAPLYRYRTHVQRAPRAAPRHYERRAYEHRGRHYRESAPGYVAPRARRVD